MMRLLDRYVLGIFLPALALFTVTLLFLFISVDFASKLGRFLDLKSTPMLPFIAKYYALRIPMLMNILVPSVLLFAPTFTVIKLARANEILPIAASGISLRRMSLPFVVAALLSSVFMAAMDEFVLPLVGDGITETDEILSAKNLKFNVEDYDGEAKIFAKSYNFVAQVLSGNVRVTLLDETKRPVQIITAEECRWDTRRKRWVAFSGFVEKPFEIIEVPGEKPRVWRQPTPDEGYVIECKLKPENIRRSAGLTNRYGFATLKSMIRDMHQYSHVPAATLKVHSRFSFPLSPVVLLLVGLPFVMDPHSQSFVKGLIFCFLLSVGYYLTHFACVDFGNIGLIPPIIAAWFPVATFGAVGIIAFARMKT
jgi:lipopolysaccharide export system permease protein